MMNNLRENNCGVFDSSDPDPTKWKKVAHVEDPLWRGKYPNPSTWSSRSTGQSSISRSCILRRRPAGLRSWIPRLGRSKRRSKGIGSDLQTSAITYDGKYVLGPFSGFQRLSSGIAVIDAETDELMGILPSNGGHHDCVIIPTKLEHMKHTRSCTL